MITLDPDEPQGVLIDVRCDVAGCGALLLDDDGRCRRHMRCTGVAASWCPQCGNCTCEREDTGERKCDLDPDEASEDPECPLHGRDSDHTEGWRRAL